ncbi:MAG: beta-ketoacyl synthase [Gammaproteobacteria bacterium]|nr:beta-ketoacyl synthase [Gammaproteobacteria bacterium]
MSNLPVIIGFGGVNPAGRTSSHHGYRRLILAHLDNQSRLDTLTDLATLTNKATFNNGQYQLTDPLTGQDQQLTQAQLADTLGEQLLNATLIRPIRATAYDVHQLVLNKAAEIRPAAGDCTCIRMRKRHLPNQLPGNWQVSSIDGDTVEVTISGNFSAVLPDTKRASVSAAGQLPDGFEPGSLYQSRNHPRNLQMTVFGASDALSSTGIPWQEIQDHIAPDRIAVYASNSIGQLDEAGFGGLLKNPSIGKRITSKQMPLGYGQMPADFVNAYLLGSVGAVGSALGACATFLYNLRNAVEDIKSGRRDLVIVGGSDAPITPEVMEGFRTMGALAEDHEIAALDGSSVADLRRTSRPFSSNCGFTMGEASQWIVLTSDSLALKLGAQIHGAVPGVFVNADGHKKSISAPGIGNYITLAKAAALTESMLGTESLRQRSCVQAHGTSTPQNRITESHVLNETAKAFNIDSWKVGAVKAYLGHSQGTAGGDQLAISLGLWRYGIFPGIATIDHVASDVHNSHLAIQATHHEVGTEGIDTVLLNSKGFGGNNASAVLMGPHVAMQLMAKKHGSQAMSEFANVQQSRHEVAAEYDLQNIRGLSTPTYKFDHGVLAGEDLDINRQQINIPGYAHSVNLNIKNPFDDMC